MNTLLTELYSPSLELVLLVVALTFNALIGYVAYRSNPKSATARFFALLTFFTTLWLINNYVSGHIAQYPQFSELALVAGRLGILWAAPMSALFFFLAHTIPSEHVRLPRLWYYASLAGTLFMMILNVSPYAFTGVSFENGFQLVPGPGLIPFSILSTLFSVLALYVLVRKYWCASGDERHQLGLMLSGMLIMLGLIITTVLLPILLFDSLFFLPFTPLYALVFLGMTAYAITKYHLFDTKVLVTEALTAAIVVILFAKMFGESTFSSRTIDGLVLASSTVLGFFLVRSVRREIELRHEVERQERALEEINEQLKELNRQKNLFLSIASHQLRSPLTAIKGYASMILEGSYGPVMGELKEAVRRIFTSSQFMVGSVQDFLDVSRIEQGTMKYDLQPLDVGTIVRTAVDELQGTAHKKGITLSFKSVGEPFMVRGDAGKLKQVFSNLVDNALKYTAKGRIDVELQHLPGGKIGATVRDTGMGMAKETLGKVFNKFVRAEDASKMDVMGTGLGLYVAREFIHNHHGKIWAESEGEGKGSTFFIELPALEK